MRTWFPHIEVYYEHYDMWWSMPVHKSIAICEKMYEETDKPVYYEWDNGRNGKKGTMWKDGAQTTRSRYELDFQACPKTQRNLDTGMVRPFRVVWVEASPEMQEFASCLMA